MWSQGEQGRRREGILLRDAGKVPDGLFKSTVPKVAAMEVVFVTSSKEDVLRLDDIAARSSRSAARS